MTSLERRSSAKQVMANLNGRRQTKAEAAAALRIRGFSFDEIATMLNYAGPKAALQAMESVLADSLNLEDKAQLRDLASRRLEALLTAVMGKAMDEDSDEQMPAQREARALIDRLISLHGLAMPQEFVLHTPTIQEMEAWVAGMVAHKMPKVIEADIFQPRAIES